MRKQKRLTWMALLPLLLAVTPALPTQVYASGPSLSVSPFRSVALTGTSFTVGIDVSDVASLLAYDITLNYNTEILSTSPSAVTTAGTLFDTVSTCPSPTSEGKCFFEVSKEVVDAAGRVRIAATLLATTVNVASTESKPLVLITFTMDGEGTTALDITDDALVVADPDVRMISHATNDGIAQTPPQLVLVRRKARSLDQVLDISKRELTTTLVATIQNQGIATAFARVRFTIVSAGGNATFVETLLAEVGPGAVVTVSTTWTAQAVPDSYVGVATLLRSPDGVLFLPGGSESFKFKVEEGGLHVGQ